MTAQEWIGAGVAFLVAVALVVAAVAVKAWHTDPMDVVRDREVKRAAEEFTGHRRPTPGNELTVRLPRQIHQAEPTVPVNVRRDETRPWGWVK